MRVRRGHVCEASVRSQPSLFVLFAVLLPEEVQNITTLLLPAVSSFCLSLPIAISAVRPARAIDESAVSRDVCAAWCGWVHSPCAASTRIIPWPLVSVSETWPQNGETGTRNLIAKQPTRQRERKAKAAQQASNTGWSVHPRALHTRVALRLPVAWCVVSWRPNQSLRRRRKPMRRPPPCLNQPRRKGLHRRPLKAQTQSRRQAHPCQASALRYPREVRVA